MNVDRVEWKNEVTSHADLFDKLGDRLPREFGDMRTLMLSGLSKSSETWTQSPRAAGVEAPG